MTVLRPNDAWRRLVAALALSVLGFAALTLAVLSLAAVSDWDRHVAAQVAGFAGPSLFAWLRVVSRAHGTVPMLIAAALAAAWVWRADRGGAALAVLAMPLGLSANHLLKHAIARPRPGLEALPNLPTDFAYPSGHVLGATLFYGMLVGLGWRRRGARPAAAIAAAAMVMLVGLSRVALGAHHASDVLGAVVEGLVWLLLGFALLARHDGGSAQG